MSAIVSTDRFAGFSPNGGILDLSDELCLFFPWIQASEVFQQLVRESTKSLQLGTRNLELQEEVVCLQRCLRSSAVDLCKIEEYKREIGERAYQKIRQKLEEVNLFLQVNSFTICICSLQCIHLLLLSLSFRSFALGI